ncbi:MAG: serpin family protein [Clostridia bacterium]|nr:serpin family protein [Clostridia bacterium]
MKKIMYRTLCLLLIAAVSLVSVGCGGVKKVNADDLMKGIEAQSVQAVEIDDTFVAAMSEFYFELYKRSYAAQEGNSLVSPLSVMLALAMTANGADGATKAEMEQTLGGLFMDDLNAYLYSYVNALPSTDKSKLEIANSIWFRTSRMTVEEDFLQTNADYYDAAAYGSKFGDDTLKAINNWVYNNTDGMIDKILDEIKEEAVMYLINAIVFDAEWGVEYNKDDVVDGVFYCANGDTADVEYLSGTEGAYFKTSNAQGFVKRYKQGYSFVGLLPDEGIGADGLVDSLSGDLIQSISEARKGGKYAFVKLPKFSYEYKLTMNKILAEMGMARAFNSKAADFSKMGTSSIGNIFIGDVLHKTFIELTEKGTRAAAVTKVEISDEAWDPDGLVTLNFDRPFVYLIIDDSTNLPVFIGSLQNIE